MGFRTASFDIALCGFMGWYDCFDFINNTFTQPDTKAKEIKRVLKAGGCFVCCSWARQEDITWMEEAVVRHYPAILQNETYLAERPVGMAYEKPAGYEIILHDAGFREVQIVQESMTFVSTEQEEWWRQMEHLGWASILQSVERDAPGERQRIKQAILDDLQPYQRADGLHFDKEVFFVRGIK